MQMQQNLYFFTKKDDILKIGGKKYYGTYHTFYKYFLKRTGAYASVLLCKENVTYRIMKPSWNILLL